MCDLPMKFFLFVAFFSRTVYKLACSRPTASMRHSCPIYCTSVLLILIVNSYLGSRRGRRFVLPNWDYIIMVHNVTAAGIPHDV